MSFFAYHSRSRQIDTGVVGVAICVAFAIALLAGPAVDKALGRVADDKPITNSILAELSSLLDERGIDTRGGLASPLPSKRPELIELSKFIVDKNIADNDIFSPLFRAGVESDLAFLVSVNAPDEPKNLGEPKFKAIWANSPPEKRIFLSFSGSDISIVREIEDVLHAKGYTSLSICKKARRCLSQMSSK